MRRPSRAAALTLCLLTAVVVLTFLTLGLSPTSRRVPLLIVVPLLGLLVLELKRGRGVDPEGPEGGESAVGGAERGTLLWVLALPALVHTLGISVGSGLFALLYFRLKSEETWVFALAAAALTGVGLWALFGLLLQTSGGGGVPILGG